MNDLKVGVLDMIFIRTTILCLMSGLLALCTGQSLAVEQSQRKTLAFRSVMGTIGFSCFTFGVSLIPLVIFQIIFNMAPFWTYFLDWAILGESMSSFEIFALIACFGSVILIATA